MGEVAVVGCQWGDEGKGKIVDRLAARAEAVVRFQGGNNAGHTIVVGGEKHVLHLLPSGILHPGVECIMDTGMVVDPEVLEQEIDRAAEAGLDTGPDRLKLSSRAHLIMPWHRLLDHAREGRSGGRRIGTTGRGIGPAYEDRYRRRGVRLADLLEWGPFEEGVTASLEEASFVLERFFGQPPLAAGPVLERFARHRERLAPYVADSVALIRELRAAGRRILYEGAQGAMLDIDYGTYPFVTSSHTLTGGLSVGTGGGPCRGVRVAGVVKAYTTRVGEGPFPTECHDPTGDWLRDRGGEYGATTGRPRRCGWVDFVALRHAVQLDGVDGIALTKLDVLSGLPKIKVAVAYRIDGRETTDFPAGIRALASAEPVWREMEGWDGSLAGCRSFEDLPPAAQAYVRLFSESLGVRLLLVSVGPERDETIVTGDPFGG